jgi:hypothetical protein
LPGNSTLYRKIALVPNGFQVFMPGSDHFPNLICNEKKCFICLIAYRGDFSLGQIKIPENHFYWKIFEPGAWILKQKRRSEKDNQLLIISLDEQTLPEEIHRFQEVLSVLNIQAMKSLINLTSETNKSAAGSLIDRLTFNAFIYTVCLGFEKEKLRFTLEQTKLVYESVVGLNTLNNTVKKMSRTKFDQICNKLYHRTRRKLEREAVLQWSMEDLVNTSKTLDLLALETGFGSREYFITAFQRQFGISPGKLRTRMRSLSYKFPS